MTNGGGAQPRRSWGLRAFLLVLVFTAGVAFLPQPSFAQGSQTRWKNIKNVNASHQHDVLISSIAGFAVQQTVRVQAAASYHDVYHIYACS